jgi:Immunoglobulin-like domain of bacterial spore germination
MRRLLLLGLVAAVAAGCGTTKTVTVTTTITTTTAAATQGSSQKIALRVYFFRDGKLGPVYRLLDSADAAALTAAVKDGPTAQERAAGFTAGDQTAELVYTLSQLKPSVPVVVGGKSYTRADFEDVTPAILVESPLPFQAVSSPLHVTGTANTFEATFEYELRDPAGKVLSHDVETATSGSGTRGTFSFTVPFEAPSGVGSLVVFERSAADGSRIHQVEIPLTLAR